jgi:ligand-binding sensor domain-containing protein
MAMNTVTHLSKSFRLLTGRLPVLLFVVLSVGSCNQEEAVVYESQINHWQHLSENKGLASNYVNTIFEDRDGNFWIGTNRGVSRFDGTSIENYSMADGLVDNNVYAISQDMNGDIWLGTARGVNIYYQDSWKYFSYFYGAAVYALQEMKNEEGMLIGTGGYGIYRYDYPSKAFGRFDFIEGCHGCNSINSLFQASDQSVWVATFEGARKIRGNFITKFDITDGLAGNIATTITEDSWGNIWVGTYEGKTISKIAGNTISQVSFNNGSDQNFIFGIQEDNKGNLWVGTVGNGLFHYDGAIMKQVNEAQVDASITSLLKDSRGNLWVGTTEGGVAIYITNPRR